MAFWQRVVPKSRVDLERPAGATGAAADDLVRRIRERAGAAAGHGGPGALPLAPFAPATAEAVDAAEESLDFALPPLLKRVLREVGNGGFGPGRGLLGVGGGATDEHGSSLVDLYDSFSATNSDDPGWRWPHHLVPLCSWGDSTYSCVDCSHSDGAIVTFDANGYRPGSDITHHLTSADLSLEAWLAAWADGADLWSLMFPLDCLIESPTDAARASASRSG